MFSPIIHNLAPDTFGYDACQHYNALIANKPKNHGTLAETIHAQRLWKAQCQIALDVASDVLAQLPHHILNTKE